MEYFLFFVGFLLIVAVVFLTAEVRRLGAQLRQEQTGTERSFAAIELAFEEMMEQLERRSAELVQELEAAAKRSAPDGRASAAVPEPADAPVATPKPHHAPDGRPEGPTRLDERLVNGGGADRSAREAAPEEAASLVEAGPDSAAPAELPESARRARALMEHGLDTVEIARALGVGRGEVQLLLALERSRRTGAHARQTHA